jgi:hypothetical protein
MPPLRSISLMANVRAGERAGRCAWELADVPRDAQDAEARRVCQPVKKQRRTSAPNLSTGYVPVGDRSGEPPQHRVGDLLRTHQLLLILSLPFNLDAARLDALLQREREAQHAVTM